MSVKAPKGRYARFITVIEPYEAEPVVKSAKALSESEVRVELMDGRVQRILIDDFDGKLGIDMVETKDGREIRHESTR